MSLILNCDGKKNCILLWWNITLFNLDKPSLQVHGYPFPKIMLFIFWYISQHFHLHYILIGFICTLSYIYIWIFTKLLKNSDVVLILTCLHRELSLLLWCSGLAKTYDDVHLPIVGITHGEWGSLLEEKSEKERDRGVWVFDCVCENSANYYNKSLFPDFVRSR